MTVLIRRGVAALEQSIAPAAPPSGQRVLYPKGDGWYELSSAGVESRVSRSGDPGPADHGFKVWSGDPSNATGNAQPAAGVLQLVELFIRGTQEVSSVTVFVITAGASLTNVGFGLYTAVGALLTSSVNANGATAVAFQSTGVKKVDVTPQTITGSFYVGFWVTGTTRPLLVRTVVGAGVANVGLAAPNLRFATANTALTDAAPATVGTQTPSNAWWAAAA